jgi:hypothetical protein
MDTLPSEEATYPLPSPRNLLLSSCQEQQTQDPPADSMMIDEPFETKASPLSASGNGIGYGGGDGKQSSNRGLMMMKTLTLRTIGL